MGNTSSSSTSAAAAAAAKQAAGDVLRLDIPTPEALTNTMPARTKKFIASACAQKIHRDTVDALLDNVNRVTLRGSLYIAIDRTMNGDDVLRFTDAIVKDQLHDAGWACMIDTFYKPRGVVDYDDDSIDDDSIDDDDERGNWADKTWDKDAPLKFGMVASAEKAYWLLKIVIVPADNSETPPTSVTAVAATTKKRKKRTKPARVICGNECVQCLALSVTETWVYPCMHAVYCAQCIATCKTWSTCPVCRGAGPLQRVK
jgi:hypothetical protein